MEMKSTVEEYSMGFTEFLELAYKKGDYLEAFSSHLNEIKDEKLFLVKKALCLGAGLGKCET